MKALLFALFLILPQFITARGSMESDREYVSLLKTTFEQILTAHEAGEITSLDGKMMLSELRDRYNKPYNDEYGILEALIDQLEENSLTYNEARYHFSLLQVGKLMEYRQERQRSESDAHEDDKKNNDDRNDGGSEQKNDNDQNDDAGQDNDGGQDNGNNKNNGSSGNGVNGRNS